MFLLKPGNKVSFV